MKIFKLVLAAVTVGAALHCGVAVAVLLSRYATAKPVTLNVFGAYPTNGVVRLYSVHTDAARVAHTNAPPAINLLPGGVLTTNLTDLFGFLFKEPVYVKFDVSTGGAFQIIGDLYNPTGR